MKLRPRTAEDAPSGGVVTGRASWIGRLATVLDSGGYSLLSPPNCPEVAVPGLTSKEKLVAVLDSGGYSLLSAPTQPERGDEVADE